MKFKWNNLSDTPKTPIEVLEDDKSEPNVYYCNVDNPTCTKRGKKGDPIKLCWDTIKELRYNGKCFHVNNESHNIFVCKECGDYFMSPINDCTDEVLEFTCFICKGVEYVVSS